VKLLFIGATGTIGQAVAAALSQRHEAVAVSRGCEMARVDIHLARVRYARRSPRSARSAAVGKLGMDATGGLASSVVARAYVCAAETPVTGAGDRAR